MYSQRCCDVSFNACARARSSASPAWTASGRTEVLENIFGVATRKSGSHPPARQRGDRTAAPATRSKTSFALLTEERRATGIFGILDIQENTTISSLKKYLKGGLSQREGR